MRTIRRFFFHSFADKILLVKATIIVVLVRLGLKLLRYQTLTTILDKTSKAKTPTQQDDAFIDRVVWAVSAASKFVPVDASCLTQALAAKAILDRRGIRGALRFGVVKDPEGELLGHAWLEIDGRVVIGDTGDGQSFTTLHPALTKD